MKTFKRKQDTRRKIQLGGLIVKAGLADEPTAVILGILVEAREILNLNNEKIRKQWTVKGDLALTSKPSKM